MSHKHWTFTTYENGKPGATERNLDSGQALAAIRAAMVGEPVVRWSGSRSAPPSSAEPSPAASSLHAA